MMDMLKKGMYVGLGLASMTKEKVEAVAKEVSAKAKLSEEEGRKFSETLHKEAESARKNFDATVEAAIEKAYAKVPCSKRFDALDKRLAAIEAALGVKRDEKPG
jgi:polyhydroxyalkanoate synthesis regulator phasin